jgi:hypothetical protein
MLTAMFTVLLIQAQSAAAAPATACFDLPTVMQFAIKAYAFTNHGIEKCESRAIARGDLDSDGQDDLAIAFNIEGACGAPELVDWKPGSCRGMQSYLIVFLLKGTSHVQVGPTYVGGIGSRLVSSVRVNGRLVELDTQEWDGDPMCCPSKKGRAAFAVEAQRHFLREVNP